jgi:hypothetical protein
VPRLTALNSREIANCAGYNGDSPNIADVHPKQVKGWVASRTLLKKRRAAAPEKHSCHSSVCATRLSFPLRPLIHSDSVNCLWRHVSRADNTTLDFGRDDGNGEDDGNSEAKIKAPA